ncbi:glycosyltransferase [Actinokineospora sp.]|uniref:glycosyltransferase n=1 Tax=Actinokineospora sp. TaxID=1872133 RepID=UPI003D6AD2C0
MGVDVVTAVHSGYARFLPDAWRSLRSQSYPRWTWLLQVDGADDTEVRAALAECGALSDPRLRLAANGTREGTAVTRNVALGRGTAPLVQTLDADDLLEPRAIAVLADALRARPAAGYAAGHARDLLPTGELREHHLSLRTGPIARGALVGEWVTEPGRYRVPLHPAGVMWRRELVVVAGGWSGLRSMEDTGLLMAVSAIAEGVLVEQNTLRYRKHPAQQSAKRSKFIGGGAQIALVRQRAELLASFPPWLDDLGEPEPRDVP